MITMEELSGTWNDIKGRAKREWGAISDDDFKQVEGNVDRLVGLIQKKTGAARTEIENTMRSWSRGSVGILNSASQTVQDATQKAQEYADQAREKAGEQYGRAQDLVRQRPAESLIISFATGLLMGVVVGLVSRSK